MTLVVKPCYRVTGPKGRRYTFAPTGDGFVTVRRFEATKEVRTERLTVSAARRRWLWLKSLGYMM